MGDVLREAYKRGWITTRDGNVSYSEPLSDVLYITPSGVDKSSITSSDIVVLKDGETDTKNASGELAMHLLLQQSNTETRAVVHLHPTYCIAAMLAGYDLQDLSHKFAEAYRYTKVAKNVEPLPSVSKELAEATRDALKVDKDGQISYNIVGQELHGVTAVGKTPWEAFEHVERLEHICQIVLVSGVKV